MELYLVELSGDAKTLFALLSLLSGLAIAVSVLENIMWANSYLISFLICMFLAVIIPKTHTAACLLELIDECKPLQSEYSEYVEDRSNVYDMPLSTIEQEFIYVGEE